jgi:diacylglycerol kinase (ATP)
MVGHRVPSYRIARPVAVRALLVVNPHARRGVELGDVVRIELERAGIQLVGAACAANGIDAIVVAGGDGSLVAQIPMALALAVPIGLVPLGTFNDLARSLSIPVDVTGACAVIAAGQTRAIDVARVNGVHYLTEASIGVSSRIARLQTPGDKQRFGLLAIAASILQAVRHAGPFHVEIGYDGKRRRLRAIQVTVANSQRFGGFITVNDAAIDDGWLDLYAVEINTFVQFVTVARAVVRGKRRSSHGVRAFRSNAFDVWTRHRHHITADGEPAGRTPARFEIMPKALRVFVP